MTAYFRQPVRIEVVTYVFGTKCYLCLKAGQKKKLVRPECQSLNSLVKVFSEWNELIEAEDIDFDSLPSSEKDVPKTSMGVPSP